MMWFIDRLKEPSTWAGFAGLAGALGLSGVLWEGISVAAIGVFSLIAIILRERAK